MSLHRTFTDAELAALAKHGLDTEGPSQLSDAFVIGLRFASAAALKTAGASGPVGEPEIVGAPVEWPESEGDATYWAAEAMRWRKQYLELRWPGITQQNRVVGAPDGDAELEALIAELVSAAWDEGEAHGKGVEGEENLQPLYDRTGVAREALRAHLSTPRVAGEQPENHEGNLTTLPGQAPMARYDLDFHSAFEVPPKDPQGRPYQAALIFNKCDGFHLVFARFYSDDGEFEGFYDWAGSTPYEPWRFYCAWAMLPDSLELYDQFAYGAAAGATSSNKPESELDKFCEGNCTWLDHHPNCPRSLKPESPEGE